MDGQGDRVAEPQTWKAGRIDPADARRSPEGVGTQGRVREPIAAAGSIVEPFPVADVRHVKIIPAGGVVKAVPHGYGARDGPARVTSPNHIGHRLVGSDVRGRGSQEGLGDVEVGRRRCGGTNRRDVEGLAVIKRSLGLLADEGPRCAGPVPPIKVGALGRKKAATDGIVRRQKIKGWGINDRDGREPSARRSVTGVPPGDRPAVGRGRPVTGRLIPDLHIAAAASDIGCGTVGHADAEGPSGPIVESGDVISLHRDDVGPRHEEGCWNSDTRYRGAGVTHADEGRRASRNGDGMSVDPDHGVVVGSHADVRGGDRAPSHDGGRRARGGIGGGRGLQGVGPGGRVSGCGRSRSEGPGRRVGAGEGVGGAGRPGGAARWELNAGGAERRDGPHRGGRNEGAGSNGSHRHGVVPGVPEDEGEGTRSHVVVGALEPPVFGVPRVGRDHL